MSVLLSRDLLVVEHDLIVFLLFQYYYASNMRLVVVGAYPLDALQDLVVKYYSDVPALPRDGSKPFCKQKEASWVSTHESPLEKYGYPFAQSSLKLYRIIPVKDRHNLSVTWQLPPQLSRWKSKPCDFIGHLLGHEAQGSLLSALKKKSWVTTCVAGVGGDSLEVSILLIYFHPSSTLTSHSTLHSLLYNRIALPMHFSQCRLRCQLRVWTIGGKSFLHCTPTLEWYAAMEISYPNGFIMN